MLSLTLAAGILAALSPVDAYWIFAHKPLLTTRLDPIVTPGAVSPHMHAIVGGGNFEATYNYNSSIAATCSTAVVQEDKSSYWTPQLYWQSPTNGSFTAVELSYVNTYYLQRPGPLNQTIVAFPPGFKMLAGSPYRHTYNASNFADQAISYVCLDFSEDHSGDPAWAEGPYFPSGHNCPSGMRAQVFFPSCWDGVRLESADQSHVAYPIQNYNGGDCPASHPVHLVSLFYEFIYSTNKYEYWGNGTWVWAFGDQTGLGFHGDFVNGWPEPDPSTGDVGLLQRAINECPAATAGVISACPVFAPLMNQTMANWCTDTEPRVYEPNGLDGVFLEKLPGNNPLWPNDELTKPGYDNYVENATISYAPSAVYPTGWTHQGCYGEGTSGRALGGYSFSSANMTPQVCIAACAARGLALAGVEYSDECYCGNSFVNGATNVTISFYQCQDACAGDATQTCGGSQTLDIFYNPSLVASSFNVPGWTAGGCVKEAVNARTLTGYSFSSSNMTNELCVNVCNSKGFTMAGTEYSSECYCGNSYSNGGGASVSSSSCDMSCSGIAAETCGGPSLLSVFTSNVPSGWTAEGCVAEGTSGRALTGYTFANDSMTPALCLNTCASKGLPIAGIEYGRECYCGTEFVNGATNTTLAATKCQMKCAGDSSQYCGGSSTLSTYFNPSLVSSGPVLPSGWAASGCRTEAVNTRTLTGHTLANKNMTVELCISTCAGLGFTIAGLEYADECYCGNSYANSAGNITTTSSCSMACAGDLSEICGGSSVLSTYTLSNATTTASKKRHATQLRQRSGLRLDTFSS